MHSKALHDKIQQRLRLGFDGFLARNFPKGRRSLCLVHGKKIRLSNRFYPTYSRSYEESVVKVLYAVAPRIKTFFDVGAHIGFSSMIVNAYHGHQPTLVAFEPNPYNMQWLKFHFEMDEMCSHSMFECVAVDSQDGYGEFHFSETCLSGSLNAGICNLNRQFYDSPIETIRVPLVSMDSYVVRKKVIPDLIKIDCEGHESRVIHGACQTLSQYHPTLIIEIHPPQLGLLGDSEEDLMKALKDLGYSIEMISRLQNGIYTILATHSGHLKH